MNRTLSNSVFGSLVHIPFNCKVIFVFFLFSNFKVVTFLWLMCTCSFLWIVLPIFVFYIRVIYVSKYYTLFIVNVWWSYLDGCFAVKYLSWVSVFFHCPSLFVVIVYLVWFSLSCTRTLASYENSKGHIVVLEAVIFFLNNICCEFHFQGLN